MSVFKVFRTFLKPIGKRLFTKHLLVTNVVMSGTMYGLGDILSQNYEQWVITKTKHKLDWHRIGEMAAIGVIIGFPLHYFYSFLDRTLIGTAARTITKKILADQLIFAAPMCALFILGIDLMEGKSLQTAWTELKNKYLLLYGINIVIWVPAQLVNFLYVDPRLRVIYMLVIVVFYDAIASFIKHQDSPVRLDVHSNTHSSFSDTTIAT